MRLLVALLAPSLLLATAACAADWDRFTGTLSVERLLTGVALDTRAMVVAPTGFAT